MAPRRASTTRLAILTVLVGLATASLAPHAVQRSAATSSGRGGWLFLTLVGILTLPALVLVVLAGVRHRPRLLPRPPATERLRTGKPWLGAMILLSLLAIAVTTMILLRPTRSEPDPGPTPSPTTPPENPAAPTNGTWLPVALAILALAIAVAVLGYRRRTPAPEPEPERSLAAAVEEALRVVVEPTPDPRTAIIHCYAAMEGALGGVPGAAPHPADSPT